MKERQRWRAEEDSILRAYVKQYGPREWNLVSQRMNKALDRDGKSCLERWKNYLKPGIKRGSLSEDEERLVISLQAKYGNKWKKIAAEVPGRTAKRLGKWWEVFKEKQQKKKSRKVSSYTADASDLGKYDHILETFAQKRLNPHVIGALTASGSAHLLPWMSDINVPGSLNSSATLSLSPLDVSVSDETLAASRSSRQASEMQPPNNNYNNIENYEVNSSGGRGDLILQQLRTFSQELEERRQAWHMYKKEASWRLKRLEQQILSQKARKRKQKIDEIEAKIRAIREDEKAYLDKLEADHMDQIASVRRSAEIKESKITEMWTAKHHELGHLFPDMSRDRL